MTHKHLTLSDRPDSQLDIEQSPPFCQIASEIEKEPSTVSKEVRR